MDEIRDLGDSAPGRIAAAESLEELDALEQELLGKRSLLAEARRTIGDAPPSERAELGALVNNMTTDLAELVRARRGELERAMDGDRPVDEAVDVTVPRNEPARGTHHLITQTIDEVVDIFVALGYRVADGPEAELAYYHFDALNIPPGHPARADMDTIYVDFGDPTDQALLRAQTSSVQIRYMEQHPPPVYLVVPGRTYRHDNDATHSPVFHQIEGLAVDDDITFGDLRGTLAHFAREFFGADKTVRFRPGFFPFTEPSGEMDVSWADGWLELLGCGMVDPAVLEAVGYSSDQVSGFAFGVGVERLAMVRHGIADIRHLYSNDIRVLRQFV